MPPTSEGELTTPPSRSQSDTAPPQRKTGGIWQIVEHAQAHIHTHTHTHTHKPGFQGVPHRHVPLPDPSFTYHKSMLYMYILFAQIN